MTLREKDGIAHSEIVSNLDIEIDRGELWNLAEQSENRKDARTAREWVIALPDELDADQRKDLAKEFAQSLVDHYGVIADIAIHARAKAEMIKTIMPISCSRPEKLN